MSLCLCVIYDLALAGFIFHRLKINNYFTGLTSNVGREGEREERIRDGRRGEGGEGKRRWGEGRGRKERGEERGGVREGEDNCKDTRGDIVPG